MTHSSHAPSCARSCPAPKLPATGIGKDGPKASTNTSKDERQGSLTDMNVTLYHRTDNWQMTGFNREELTLAKAYSFEVEVDVENIHRTLEHIFRINNRVDGSAIEIVPYNSRSMCAGDVVVIGETAWFCASVGWEPLTTEEFCMAIAETQGALNG